MSAALSALLQIRQPYVHCRASMNENEKNGNEKKNDWARRCVGGFQPSFAKNRGKSLRLTSL